MVTEHDGVPLISDKGSAGRAFETLPEVPRSPGH